MPVLIVEDGTIVADANSYVSVDDATAYFDTHPDQATWDDAGEDRQIWALIRATRYLEARYSGRWRGAPVGFVGSMTGLVQNLSWPRVVYSPQGYLYGSVAGQYEIPSQLIEAECELALRDIREGSLSPDKKRGAYVTSESVGPLSVSYRQDAPSKTQFPELEVILSPLLEGNLYQMQVVRG